jgi:hypothetical protein
MSAISRNVVCWIGAPLPAQDALEFSRRNLALRTLSANDVLDTNICRGLVLFASSPHIPNVMTRAALVKDALNAGLMVYLLAADDATQALFDGEFTDEIRKGRMAENIRRRTGDALAHEIAENIARHDPGRHCNTALEITLPAGLQLDEEDIYLVRRAFSDCASVSLTPLTGGRSATAFSVQATLVASEVGPRPLPFFMKLDECTKISTEANNYKHFAEHHIPWYLRPNIDSSRCILGVAHGILVGSFVGQSESLWQAVLAGKGPRYIHALFEETLLGWRSQSYHRDVRKGRIASSLTKVFSRERVLDVNLDAARTHGEVLTPKAAWELLLNLPEQAWRSGSIHGDMHGENVRVRNNDAIIIDLAKATSGPISCDVASLEVWLAFEVPADSTAVPNRDVWLKTVTDLFDFANVATPPPLSCPAVGLEWLHACIRQTRMTASSISECANEYATVVALHLLRRAQHSRDNNLEDAFRRGVAYFLGSRLVEALTADAYSEREDRLEAGKSA